jgi:hypothetical protein
MSLYLYVEMQIRLFPMLCQRCRADMPVADMLGD